MHFFPRDGSLTISSQSSIMFSCDSMSDHASWNEVFHTWDTKLKLTQKHENTTFVNLSLQSQHVPEHTIKAPTIGHCVIVNNMGKEFPEHSKNDVKAVIKVLQTLGYEWNEENCKDCIYTLDDLYICKSCQMKNKIHKFEDCTFKVGYTFNSYIIIIIIIIMIMPPHNLEHS